MARMLILLAAVLVINGYLLMMVFIIRRTRQRRADEQLRRARLAARADLQNQWFLAGDPRGLYGEFPEPGRPPVDRRRRGLPASCRYARPALTDNYGGYPSGPKPAGTPPIPPLFRPLQSPPPLTDRPKPPPDKSWIEFETIRRF